MTMRWRVSDFDWKDVASVYFWVKGRLEEGMRVALLYTGGDHYALTATTNIPAYLALIKMPGIDPIVDPMEIPNVYFQFQGDTQVPEWFREEVAQMEATGYNAIKVGAEVGTDTAAFYVIAPEQMWHLYEDQEWVAKAKKLWGDKSSGDVGDLIKEMAKLVRQYGGAHLSTGHDGSSDVGFTKKEKGQKEEGLLPPYGTPDFRKGKKAAQRIASRWLFRR